MTQGEYRVVGRREYRGHPPNTVFVAQIDTVAERRAIVRGDIRLLRRVTPSIEPGTAMLPAGWGQTIGTED